MRPGKPFEPEITAFYCIYCGYMAADTAGALGIQYPANVKFTRLPCTGKVNVNYIMSAFERGIDGVLVAGCLEGGCHFLEGNLRARRRVERAKTLLDEIGLGSGRLEMFNLSSAEGPRFAEITTEMHDQRGDLFDRPVLGRCEGVVGLGTRPTTSGVNGWARPGAGSGTIRRIGCRLGMRLIGRGLRGRCTMSPLQSKKSMNN